MTASLKVLWLARHLPVPLNAGDRIYTARLVEALGRAGADVHFLGLANPEYPELDAAALDSAVSWEIIPGRPRSLARAMLSKRPVLGARFGTIAYERRVKEPLSKNCYDAVVVDQYGLAWTLPLIERLKPALRPIIVHLAHDFETEVTHGIAVGYRGNPLRKAALMLNARRTAVAERALALRSDLIVALTQRDCDSFAEIGSRSSFLVVPPGYDGANCTERAIVPETPRRVGIVGSYRWTAKQMNLSAFLEAADDVLADAGIDLAIVGDAPTEYRAGWAGRLRAGRFLGFVDDLGEFLNSCRMGLVIEAIGGGFKLKVLDYAFTRTPVGALSPALGGQAPAVTEHFLIADTAVELARAIVVAIDDLDRLNAMQDGAYRAATPLYDWNVNGQRMVAAIRKMTSR